MNNDEMDRQWRAFLRAGGCLTPTVWFQLPEDTKGIIERAGTAVMAERILALMSAFSDPDVVIEALNDPDSVEEAEVSAKLAQALKGHGTVRDG